LSDCLVIIPTFNEKENVEAMVRKVFSLAKPFHILVVDDDSPDGTAQIVKKLQLEFPESLFLLERKGKQGLGTAYIAGFRYGLNRNYAYIFEMDCDFSHDPEDLIRLHHACHKGGYDMSIGSRYVTGGRVENWPWDRIALSYGASLYVRIITWMNIKDPTAGFVCYKHEVLNAIDLDKIKFIGYAFQIEMKYAVLSLGFKIKEVPITFKDRVLGSSKISKGIVKEGFMGVLKMASKRLFTNYRKSN